MNYIKVPNLPDKAVGLAVVDGRISKNIEMKLTAMGITVLKTGKYPGVYDAVSSHPDIVLHHVGDKRIVYAPGTDAALLNSLQSFGFTIIKGERELSFRYPGNIAYNVARVGTLAFHNLKYTDTVLRNELAKEGVELVHINQGYAKCSISIVDQRSIITTDAGIVKVAEKKELDVLFIKPGSEILLPGIGEGLIGGSSGLLDIKKWAVTGKVETLKSYTQIQDFLDKKKIEIISLTNGQIIDIGSIIPLLTK